MFLRVFEFSNLMVSPHFTILSKKRKINDMNNLVQTLEGYAVENNSDELLTESLDGFIISAFNDE